MVTLSESSVPPKSWQRIWMVNDVLGVSRLTGPFDSGHQGSPA